MWVDGGSGPGFLPHSCNSYVIPQYTVRCTLFHMRSFFSFYIQVWMAEWLKRLALPQYASCLIPSVQDSGATEECVTFAVGSFTQPTVDDDCSRSHKYVCEFVPGTFMRIPRIIQKRRK